MIVSADYIKIETSIDSGKMTYTIVANDDRLNLNIYELNSLKRLLDKII